jgi:hypothetical protein
MGACGYECLAGYEDTGSACEMRVARPLFPWGLSTVTMLRPTLRWELPMGVEGAQVELCRDRACTTVIERVNAVGTSARPSADLPASTVVFWRLRGRIGAVNSARTSATWQFRTPARSATTADTAHGVELDVNGDGYSDVAIGAPGADGNTGRVDVYYGSAAGLGATPAVRLSGSAMGEFFGRSVASLGDVNGDGFGDLGISAGGTGGRAVVFHGGAGASFGTTPPRTLVGASSEVGCIVAGLGDVNGDGYADAASACESASPAGVSEAGAAQIFLGAPTGIRTVPLLTITGATVGEAVGRAVHGAGDVNGDRLADVAIGAAGAQNALSQRTGAVRIYLGAAVAPTAMPAATLSGVDDLSNFGGALDSTADVNGDGFSDVLVGADGAAYEGRARCGTSTLFLGAATGVATVASATLSGSNPGDQFGSALTRAGDVNGDGFDDIVVASRWAAPGGQVKIFYGTASGLPLTAARAVDASGAADFFGDAVRGLSDVNGDGFCDFGVAAPGATVSGRMNAGTLSVFVGRSGGVGASPARVLDGMLAGERFGTAIAAVRRRGSDGPRCVAHRPTTQGTSSSRRRMDGAPRSADIWL